VSLIIRGPQEGPTYTVAGDLYRFLAEGRETGGNLFVFQATIPPGGGPPPHIHRREDECFYILKGQLTFYVIDENRSYQAEPGSFVHLPKGRLHRFANETDQPAEALIWTTPAGLDEFFRQAGHASDRALPPQPEDFERLLKLAPQFEIEILR